MLESAKIFRGVRARPLGSGAIVNSRVKTMILGHRTLALTACAVCLAVRPLAAESLALNGYNAAISESSISGVSSGAFMAVQFGTAWSSVIKGVGIVAGGPYWCAKADSFFGYWSSLSNALGPCMKGPLPGLDALFAKADAKSRAGAIDPLHFVS